MSGPFPFAAAAPRGAPCWLKHAHGIRTRRLAVMSLALTAKLLSEPDNPLGLLLRGWGSG